MFFPSQLGIVAHIYNSSTKEADVESIIAWVTYIACLSLVSGEKIFSQIIVKKHLFLSDLHSFSSMICSHNSTMEQT